jgi:hypothetical protein
MRPNELVDGMKVLAKFSRRDIEDGTAPDWSEPKVVTLLVQRRDRAYNKKHPAGELLVMTPKEFSWAEYGERDWSEQFDEWLVEEYRMKIISVVKE